MDAGAGVVAAFCFLAFVFLAPVLLWHCKSKNVPAICLICWFMIMALINFINLCIWSGDNFYEKWDGKVYCDIAVRVDNAASSGKVAAISAISINLFSVLCAKSPSFLEQGTRRKLIFELLVCLATPVFVMGASKAVESSRYSILRYRGCVLTFKSTPGVIGLYSMWSVVWSVVGLVFASLTVFKYIQRRVDVKDLLRCSNSGLNIRRFARLLIFNISIIVVMFPLSIYYLVNDITTNEQPGYGYWDILYYDFRLKDLYKCYTNLALSFVGILIFGLGSDALEMYKGLFRFGKKPTSDQMILLEYPPQTKVNSAGSGWTNNSTMREFREFADLVSENGEKLESYVVNCLDLEAGKIGERR